MLDFESPPEKSEIGSDVSNENEREAIRSALEAIRQREGKGDPVALQAEKERLQERLLKLNREN